MLEIFSVVKTVAIIQLILVIVLLLFAYGVKIFSYYRTAYLNQSINDFIKHCIEQPADCDLKSIMKYKQRLDILINIIHQLDVDTVDENWMHLRIKLMDLIHVILCILMILILVLKYVKLGLKLLRLLVLR